MTQKSILTISRDTTLQDVRAHVLRQAGFHVASASNDEEAIGFLDRPNSFSLVLMCHSVPEWSRRALVTKSKELYPKLPILLLCNGYDPTTTSVDSPEAMLEMILRDAELRVVARRSARTSPRTPAFGLVVGSPI